MNFFCNEYNPTPHVPALPANIVGVSCDELKNPITFRNAGWNDTTIWLLREGLLPVLRNVSFHLSATPIAETIMTGDTAITGFGHAENSVITVELPNGTRVTGRTNRNLEWSVNIPRGTVLREDDEIRITQQEIGKPTRSLGHKYFLLCCLK
jgi:hypothetical protein